MVHSFFDQKKSRIRVVFNKKILFRLFGSHLVFILQSCEQTKLSGMEVRAFAKGIPSVAEPSLLCFGGAMSH